nr:alpha/beta-hydrolase family protein [Brevibacterium daeguense]
MIPRTWWMTAVNVAANAFAGQKIAEAVESFLSPLRRRRRVSLPTRPPEETEFHWRTNTLILAAAVTGTTVALDRSMVRQTEIGRLTGIHSDTTRQQLAGYVVGAAGWLAIDVLLALTESGRQLAVRRLRRRLPFLPEAVLSTAVLGLIAYTWRSVLSSTLNRIGSQAVISDFARPSISTAPPEPERTGSRASFEPFATLGYHGRGFVSAGPRAARITEVLSAVQGRCAERVELSTQTPIRVFIGRLGHPDLAEAANAAVAELERAGAFERDAILLVTNTGSGWIPQWSVEAFEYLTGGRCATAAVQYSFAGSWLAFLIHRRQAQDASRELFRAVSERIARCPAERRPRIYLAGESLGALGGHGAFRSSEHMQAGIDGAVWTGTPRTTRIHAQLTADRRSFSPEILPVVGRGDRVRFVSRPADLRTAAHGEPYPQWESPRIVYAQHASDPIVWWEPRLIWRRPDWLEERRGTDVSSAVHWMPWITFWQLTSDMPRSVKLPGGFGHNYHREVVHYWNAVLDTGLSEQACARIGDAIADDLGARSGSLPLTDPAPWQAGRMEGERRSLLSGLSRVLLRPQASRADERRQGSVRRRG